MRDRAYFLVGLGFLALSKAKHALRGYTTPKPFSDPEASVRYALSHANGYIDAISRAGVVVEGKRILELGPGSDLGIGLCLLHAGAIQYVAVDRYPLARDTPPRFYERLASASGVSPGPLSDRSRLRYEVRTDFDLRGLGEFDVILSNAAFEHFDDVDGVIQRLAELAAPDALLFSEIDLQTHTRWIRDRDPNNIYRYPERLYRVFYFPGQPNRVRPDQYRRALERAGWRDIEMTPENRFDPRGRSVHGRFRADPHLDWLSFTVTARRPA